MIIIIIIIIMILLMNNNIFEVIYWVIITSGFSHPSRMVKGTYGEGQSSSKILIFNTKFLRIIVILLEYFEIN